MRITKIDVTWNFSATFFRVASNALLLPLILKLLPAQEVGLWTIFMSVTFLVNLVDFGFNTSFARNISYIFSGVRELKAQGYSGPSENEQVDYSLLKGTIASMRWFYLRISLIILVFLATAGTFYISIILKDYNGDRTYAFIAWVILCLINTLNLYTFYYDALLVGRGLIKRSKQIIVLSQVIFLCFASAFLIMGFGIVAIVSAQLIYVIITRILSHRVFFTRELRQNLNNSNQPGKSKVLKAIYPNAIKLGFTVLGGILVQRSAVFIGSIYLPLQDIASYGMTRQIFDILSGFAPVFITTYIPLIAKCRVEGNTGRIKEIYLRGTIISIIVFFSCGLMVYFFGNSALMIIKSETVLLPGNLIIAAMIVSFIEMNHSSAAGILLTKNEVPFFKPSIISGVTTALLIYIFLQWTDLGMLSLFLAPGLVDIAYQSWKWPLEVVKDLKIHAGDLRSVFTINSQ